MTADDAVTATLAQWAALTENDPLYVLAESLATLNDPQHEGVRRRTTLDSIIAHAEFALGQPSAITAMPALLGLVREVQHILATQRHEVIGARGLREQDVVRARDIEQAVQKWIGGSDEPSV